MKNLNMQEFHYSGKEKQFLDSTNCSGGLMIKSNDPSVNLTVIAIPFNWLNQGTWSIITFRHPMKQFAGAKEAWIN